MSNRSSMEIIEAIASLLDAKNAETLGHSKRVAQFVVALGERLGLTIEELQQLEKMARLHDIGKVGIPDSILNKPSMLNEEEYSIMKSHTLIGAEILANLNDSELFVMAAKYHHERYDGKGYFGKTSSELPLMIRILALADALDAMTSYRKYQRNIDSTDAIVLELLKGRGTQFDPAVTDVAVSCLQDKIFDSVFEEERILHRKQMQKGQIGGYVCWEGEKKIPDFWTHMESLEYIEQQATEYSRLGTFPGIIGLVCMQNYIHYIDEEGHRRADQKFFELCTYIFENKKSFELMSRTGDDCILFYVEKNEQLQERYEKLNAFCQQRQIAITIGLASMNKSWSFKSVVERARLALYHAQRSNLGYYVDQVHSRKRDKDKWLCKDKKWILNHLPMEEAEERSVALITITPSHNSVFEMQTIDKAIALLERNFAKLSQGVISKRFSSTQLMVEVKDVTCQEMKKLLNWGISEYLRQPQSAELELQWEILTQ